MRNRVIFARLYLYRKLIQTGAGPEGWLAWSPLNHHDTPDDRAGSQE